MKFIHTADIHLGASPDSGSAFTKKRTQEIWNSFAGLVKTCEEQQIDVLLIAGDLFHRQPLLRELKEVNYLFSKLSMTKVVLVAGNHDYMKKDSYYHTFQWENNVHMLKGGDMSCVELPELSLAVYGCSYYSRENRENIYDYAVPQQRQRYEILLAHGGDENHIPIQKNKLDVLGYDYVALGHIHKPQVLVSDRMAYCGALEPIDKNDTGSHGYIQGEIRGDKIKINFVPCAVREYIHTKIVVNDSMTGYALKEAVKAQIERLGIHNIYKVILTGYHDPEIRFDFSGLDTYGNIVEVSDLTKPAYDFEKLMEQNTDNLIGRYIEKFKDSDRDSVEYLALCEGVQALMETRRGQA